MDARRAGKAHTRQVVIVMDTYTHTNFWVAWPFVGPWRMTPLVGGTNNNIQRAETPTGEQFVLRIQPDTTLLPRMRYEVELLTRLQAANLPFAVPVPIPARTGAYFVSFSDDVGNEAMATLWPLLPGAHPDRHDLRLAFVGAQALAQLDLEIGRAHV